MGSFWNDELKQELSNIRQATQDSLEKQRYNEGLIRILRDSRTKALFAALEVARVSQLDAASLDDELIKMLRDQTERALSMFTPLASIVASKRSELDLSLRLLLWWFTLRINIASPGETLQNLRFRNERLFNRPHLRGLLTIPGDRPTRSQRLFHLLLSVFAPWIWNRLRDRAVEERWGENRESEHLWSGLEAADKAFRVASLANFLFFLVDGRYRCLTDRLLKMRLIPAKNESVRAVSFELINQQLLFEGFTEILLVILPLIDWDALFRLGIKAKNLTSRLFLQVMPTPLLERLGFPVNSKEAGTILSDVESLKCVSCGTNPAVMASRALPCRHVYCYFCIKTHTSKYSSATCLSCDQSILSTERL